jgi:hypothetical protein
MSKDKTDAREIRREERGRRRFTSQFAFNKNECNATLNWKQFWYGNVPNKAYMIPKQYSCSVTYFRSRSLRQKFFYPDR